MSEGTKLHYLPIATLLELAFPCLYYKLKNITCFEFMVVVRYLLHLSQNDCGTMVIMFIYNGTMKGWCSLIGYSKDDNHLHVTMSGTEVSTWDRSECQAWCNLTF